YTLSLHDSLPIYQELKNELRELNENFKEKLKDIEIKEIIVSHAAYGYWEERYGINQIAISGFSPSEEPSQKELTHVVDTAEENNLKHIIFEQNVSNKLAKTIQKEINAETLQIHNLSVLTEEDINNTENYFSLMKYNLEDIDKATSN